MTTLWIPTWLGTKISIECSVYLRCRVIYLFGGVNHLHPFVKSQEHEGGPDQTDLDLRVHRVHLWLTYYMSWRVYKWSLVTKSLTQSFRACSTYSREFWRLLLFRKSTFCQKVTVHRDRNPLHKQFEKACMYFKTRCVRTLGR